MIQDLQEECGKFGQVMRVTVPRPTIPAQAKDLLGTENYGKVCTLGKIIWQPLSASGVVSYIIPAPAAPSSFFGIMHLAS